jgi:hypothetical protein
MRQRAFMGALSLVLVGIVLGATVVPFRHRPGDGPGAGGDRRQHGREPRARARGRGGERESRPSQGWERGARSHLPRLSHRLHPCRNSSFRRNSIGSLIARLVDSWPQCGVEACVRFHQRVGRRQDRIVGSGRRSRSRDRDSDFRFEPEIAAARRLRAGQVRAPGTVTKLGHLRTPEIRAWRGTVDA